MCQQPVAHDHDGLSTRTIPISPLTDTLKAIAIMADYRVDLSIMKRETGQEDFTEFAFGSTMSSTTIQEAGFDAHAAIQNEEWDEV